MPETDFLFFGSFVPADRWERETHAPSRESPAAQQPTPATDSPADPQGDHRKAAAAGRKSSGNWPKQYSKSTFSLWKPIISYNFGHAARPQETPAAAAMSCPHGQTEPEAPPPRATRTREPARPVPTSYARYGQFTEGVLYGTRAASAQAQPHGTQH